MYVRIFIMRIYARRRRSLNEAFLVKNREYNFMPTAWIPLVSVFCSSGAVSGIRGKQMTPAVASERNIFSKNHDSNSSIKSFPCHGEHVHTYISGCRCTQWQKTIYEQTHTHMRDSHSDDNNKNYSKRCI